MQRSTRRLIVASLCAVIVVVVALAAWYVKRLRDEPVLKLPSPASAPIDPVDTAWAQVSWVAPMTRADGSPLADIAHYRVVYGTSPRRYTGSLLVPNDGTLTATVKGLAWDKTWYFAVIAVDRSGRESAPSAEVSKFTRK